MVATDDFTIDLAAKRVRRGSEEIHLTPTEWQIVEVLAQSWQADQSAQPAPAGVGAGLRARNALPAHLHEPSAQKLEPDPSRPRYFITEPGMGYRFVVEES